MKSLTPVTSDGADSGVNVVGGSYHVKALRLRDEGDGCVAATFKYAPLWRVVRAKRANSILKAGAALSAASAVFGIFLEESLGNPFTWSTVIVLAIAAVAFYAMSMALDRDGDYVEVTVDKSDLQSAMRVLEVPGGIELLGLYGEARARFRNTGNKKPLDAARRTMLNMERGYLEDGAGPLMDRIRGVSIYYDTYRGLSSGEIPSHLKENGEG